MARRPRIYVLAGTNGAGKSSIGGAMIRATGGDYFNPDEAARKLRLAEPGLSVEDANSLAWELGRRTLERALDQRLDFALETTLGGRTITDLLDRPASQRIEVRIWYVGLISVELHLARVKARVSRGGHDIPEERIRGRFDSSRLNLIRLMPRLTELRVYDNSSQAVPERAQPPAPQLVLHMRRGRVVDCCPLESVPDWAKPIMAAALRPS